MRSRRTVGSDTACTSASISLVVRRPSSSGSRSRHRSTASLSLLTYTCSSQVSRGAHGGLFGLFFPGLGLYAASGPFQYRKPPSTVLCMGISKHTSLPRMPLSKARPPTFPTGKRGPTFRFSALATSRNRRSLPMV
jgi:hypothetical protein